MRRMQHILLHIVLAVPGAWKIDGSAAFAVVHHAQLSSKRVETNIKSKVATWRGTLSCPERMLLILMGVQLNC